MSGIWKYCVPLALGLIAAIPAAAQAQTDATIALNKARDAFAAAQFEQARDLLVTAAQTDPDNPDIHLLLGKSFYQLGDVEQAVKAWQTTIGLAPEQAYAKRMLANLRGVAVDTKTRLAIAAGLLQNRLYQQAAGELSLVRRSAKLTDNDRQQLLLLEAELALGQAKPADAMHRLEELAIRFPNQKEQLATQLLTARSQVATGGDALADGLAKLAELGKQNAKTRLGARAELELMAFRFHQGAVDADAILGWIAAHADHPAKSRAQEVLVTAIERLLSATMKGPAAKAEANLTADETKALSIAAKVYPTLLIASQADALTYTLVKHFQLRYHAADNLVTASDALDALAKLALPPSSQRFVNAAQRALAIQIATVQYDRIAGRLLQKIDDSIAMAQWIKTHPEHDKAAVARQALLNFYLASTLRQKPTTKGSPLSATDAKAFVVAAEIYDRSKQVKDALQLTTQLDQHLKSRYVASNALKAAATGYESLLKLKPPASSEALLLNGFAAVQTRIAIDQLTADAIHGQIKAGPLPASLKAVLATLQRINQLTPATPGFAQQAALGQQVAGLSSHLVWPPQVSDAKPTQEWAIEIMLPVIADGTQPAAVKAADATIAAIVTQLSALSQPTADSLPAQVQARRLAVLEKGSDAWGLAMLRRTELLIAAADRKFQRNIEERRNDVNAKLSAPQQAVIDTLKELVTVLPAQSPTAVARLQLAMSHPLSARHYDVVFSANEALRPALPEAQQFDIQLAQLRLLVRQVTDRDAIARQRGLKIEPQLDPLMKKALLGLYEMQRDLKEGDPRLAQARSVVSSVTTYYRELEMFDVVEAAWKVSAEKAIPMADRFAQYQLAGLQFDAALREQTQQLKEFRGRELIKFTPAFASAENAYQKFITDHPDDARAITAVEQLTSIARLFQQQQREEIAAEVYARLEAFAARQPRLNQVPAGQSTVAARAAIATAIAWHQHASRMLEKQLSKQAADAPPPAALSPGHIKALAAYAGAVKRHPDSPLVTAAFSQTLSIGREYANHGAWDVADSVYDGVLAQKLPLQHPERLEFAQALCQLGKVMPEHSRAILTTLVEGGQSRPAVVDPAMIAQNRPGQDAGRKPDAGDGLAQGPGANTASQPNDPKPVVTEIPVPADLPELSAGQQAEVKREAELLAAVQFQQGQQARQIAQLRDAEIQFRFAQIDKQAKDSTTQFVSTVISDAELDRQQKVLDKAYAMLQALRTRYPQTATAAQSRGEILIIVGHWRKLSKWKRSADLAVRYLQDNPKDANLPSIRQEIARDYLAWAAAGVDEEGSKQELLDIVNRRHTQAREELAGIVKEFPDNDVLRQHAQWEVANSFLTQARVIATLSPTLARGQYVRSANELMQVARQYHDHPKIGEVPQMLWTISHELSSRKHFDEAIAVWNSLANNYPLHELGQQAALQIAQAYQTQNKPLRAVEAYVELNFARGGNDIAMQNAIYQLAVQLKGQKRWVEALHALETFVDSFPAHANAGQALTMIGQIHQANKVWEDAIAAYDRVIIEYPGGAWGKEARWSIAECTINLSRWRDAIDSYDKFANAYQGDDQAKQAMVRIEILKDLDRYQRVVDEEGQRKSFDAQYQIGEIVRSKLANNVKAIIEFRKVATNWPESHLADDALYQVGVTYLTLGETEHARDALLAAAEKYPTSPLADDALLKIGQSYQQEAAKYATVTRVSSVAEANDTAQNLAYYRSQDNRRMNRDRGNKLVSKLKEQGEFDLADELVARNAAVNKSFDYANAQGFAQWATQEAQALTAQQLADRQDKVNASLRSAVAAFQRASSTVTGDKADDALLQMAQIYDTQLKDADAAMKTWKEIVKQFSGTGVAEDASWKIAQYYEQHAEYQQAINAYQGFLRNYRTSPKAGQAQAAIAENYEHLGKWVDAMDAYSNYLTNFPQGPLVAKAKQQINWIKTYRL